MNCKLVSARPSWLKRSLPFHLLGCHWFHARTGRSSNSAHGPGNPSSLHFWCSLGYSRTEWSRLWPYGIRRAILHPPPARSFDGGDCERRTRGCYLLLMPRKQRKDKKQPFTGITWLWTKCVTCLVLPSPSSPHPSHPFCMPKETFTYPRNWCYPKKTSRSSDIAHFECKHKANFTLRHKLEMRCATYSYLSS